MAKDRFEVTSPFDYGKTVKSDLWGCYETVPGVFIAFGDQTQMEQLTALLNDNDVHLTGVWLHTGQSPGD